MPTVSCSHENFSVHVLVGFKIISEQCAIYWVCLSYNMIGWNSNLLAHCSFDRRKTVKLIVWDIFINKLPVSYFS